jgi:vacuolar protein sorting-associated protein 18 homolog
LLKIDDLLPWFPDFVVLDKFKDHIVESLEDYNSQIDELKQEMENYTESAEHIRQEIRGLKTRHGTLQGEQVCELCDQPILSRVFYLFPCSHAFHSDCLLTEVSELK